MNVSDLQLLILEVGESCPLAHLHLKCPAHLGTDRYERLDCSHLLDDDTIVATARSFYRDRGFTGLIGWHYYCEPLLYAERMFGLMARIRRAVPLSRFLLWTNGTLIPSDPVALAQFALFERVVISDYGDEYSPRVGQLGRVCPSITVIPAHLDERRQELGQPSDATCQRPYTEFIVDCFGNVHLCCIDWRGLASPGNVLRDGLDSCVVKWRDTAAGIVCTPMAPNAPEACRRCPMRFAERSNFA